MSESHELVVAALNVLATPEGRRNADRVLGMIATKVEQEGAGLLWSSFLDAPNLSEANGNKALIRILAEAADQDGTFAHSLRSLVGPAAEETERPERTRVEQGGQSVSVGSFATVRGIKDNRRIAIGNTTYSARALLVFLAMLLAAVVLLGYFLLSALPEWLGGDEESLAVPEDYTCREYLSESSDEERARIVRQVGVELEISDAGHPWSVDSMDYYCGQAPDGDFRSVMSQGWGLDTP